MKIIALSRDMVALVDEEDYGLLSRYRWNGKRARNTFDCYYAQRSNKTGVGPSTIYMHRVIMGVTDTAMQIDHINGDGLDNRRANLRVCTGSQNSCARRRYRLASSGYRGVYRDGKLYAAQLTVNGRTKKIGLYLAPRDAAIAFDQAARQQYGEFAVLNFPELAA